MTRSDAATAAATLHDENTAPRASSTVREPSHRLRPIGPGSQTERCP